MDYDQMMRNAANERLNLAKEPNEMRSAIKNLIFEYHIAKAPSRSFEQYAAHFLKANCEHLRSTHGELAGDEAEKLRQDFPKVRGKCKIAPGGSNWGAV